MNSSSAPKSWTKPNSTSAIEGPEATAMLRLWEGIVRRALSEPSIGSITTRAAPPSPKTTSPRSSETATKEAPCRAPAPRARRRPRPRSGGRSPGCDRRPRRPPRRRCAPRCSRSPSKIARWAATMRRQIPSQSAEKTSIGRMLRRASVGRCAARSSLPTAEHARPDERERGDRPRRRAAAAPRRRRDRQDRAAGAAPGAPGRRRGPGPSGCW